MSEVWFRLDEALKQVGPLVHRGCSGRERRMSEERKELIAALVGERADLYHTSAWFYQAVNVLADLLPTWVDGLAERAREKDAEMAQDILAASKPPVGIVTNLRMAALDGEEPK